MTYTITLDEAQAEALKQLIADHVDSMDRVLAAIEKAQSAWPAPTNIQPSMRVSGFQMVEDWE